MMVEEMLIVRLLDCSNVTVCSQLWVRTIRIQRKVVMHEVHHTTTHVLG